MSFAASTATGRDDSLTMIGSEVHNEHSLEWNYRENWRRTERSLYSVTSPM